MEVVVAQPILRQPVQVRRLAEPAVATELLEAHVVEDDEEHVLRALRRLRVRRPPWLGLVVNNVDLAVELPSPWTMTCSSGGGWHPFVRIAWACVPGISRSGPCGVCK